MNVVFRPRRVVLALILVLGILLFILPTVASATTLYVSTNGNDTSGNGSQGAPFKTIQKAVDTAVSGDIVAVAAGTYGKNGTSAGATLDFKNGITIRGAGAGKTILRGGFGGVNVRNMEFAGFTFNTVSTTFYFTQGGNITIRNCVLIGSGQGEAIHDFQTSMQILNNTINRYSTGINSISDNTAANLISGNTISNCTNGIILDLGSSPTVVNNVIVKNKGAGITGSRSNAIIINDTIADNRGAGIVLGPPTGWVLTITNCILWNNGDDLSNCTATYSCVKNGDAGTSNIAVNPLLKNNYSPKASSPCIDTGTATGAPTTDILGTTRPQGSGFDMGAYEYVKK